VAEIDVLVVDDAPEYSQLICDVLADAGYRPRSARTVAAATEAMSAAMPDLVILDLGLPDGDGLDLCRTIRDHSNAYVVVVSGRADELEKLSGFRLGADDFLLKPFSARELAARVDALLRRPRADLVEALPRVLGDLMLYLDARVVMAGGAKVDLTRIEFDLLDVLTASPTHVFTRRQLLEKVWGPNWFGDEHIVDVHVANLRRKIDLPDQRSVIRTVRGVGYRMAL
jgi:DNA-binding response OmpR family regulator